MTRNLNPNQFALPGMEHMAHPLAPYVAEGAHFEFKTERVPAKNEWDLPNDPERVGRPRTHSLEARYGEKDIGALDWRGSHTKGNEDIYPGEIKWVGRAERNVDDLYRDEEAGVWRERNAPPPMRGIMTSMFRFAHEVPQPSQSTVPLHSPDRSFAGETWAQAVGDYGHGMPEAGEFGWMPAKGTHPYEAEAKAERKAVKPPKKMKGQKRLPGIKKSR